MESATGAIIIFQGKIMASSQNAKICRAGKRGATHVKSPQYCNAQKNEAVPSTVQPTPFLIGPWPGSRLFAVFLNMLGL
jgi:hypothetical protein